MGDSVLFTGGCCNNITPKQLKSLSEACIDTNVFDTAACIQATNTCGLSAKELLETYPIYNPQKGLYKSWGDIDFPWEVVESTPNLFVSETDDKWSVSKYRAIVAYAEGTKVVYIADDGYTLEVYEALEDVLSFPFELDKSKWEKVCQVKTTVPFGILSIEELLSKYKKFSIEEFYKNWGDIEEGWESNLQQNAIQVCLSQNPNLTPGELEECLKDKNSDVWNEARARRVNFYNQGDIFINEGVCGDVICLYIVTENVEVTDENYNKYERFIVDGPWQKVYCVSTGVNKCLGVSRSKEPSEGYELVEIGSKGHYVEAPIPYKLKPRQKEIGCEILQPSRKILSQLEIDILDGTLPPDCIHNPK
jgi:hypothetical protein